MTRDESDSGRHPSEPDHRHHRLMFEHAGVGIGSYALDGTILFMNRRAARYMGGEPDDFAGKHCTEVFPAEVARMIRERIDRLVRARGPLDFEDMVEVPEGRYWFHSTYALVRDPDTGDEIVQIVSSDVTVQKMAVEELDRARHMLEQAEDLSHVGSLRADLARGTIEVSESWKRIHGCARSTVTLADFEELIHVDDRLRVRRMFDELVAAPPGAVSDFHYRIVRADTGEVRQMHARATLMRDADAAPACIHGATRDVTESSRAGQALRESEERYRSLFDGMRQGIALISSDFRILSINPQFREWMPGIDISDQPHCYRAFNDPPRDEVCTYCPVVRTLEDGKVHEAITETPAGDTIRNYRIVASPLRDSAGKVIAAIESVEDVTDRVRMEAELARVDKLESIGRLAGGIAHDFNNLLMVIIGNTYLARSSDRIDADTAELLDEVDRAARRAQHLTQQLLTFSKSGRPVRRVTSVERIVREASQLAVRGSHSRCEVRCDAALRQAELDEGQIWQAVHNLVENAKASMPDGGTIEVRCSDVTLVDSQVATLPAGDYIRIDVADRGTGIAEEHLDQVFDPFFTTRDAGHGLGLATVHSIVQRHGGHVTVASKQGQGSVFSVFLPAATGAAIRDQAATDRTRGGDVRRILIMDDEEPLRTLAARSLERLGHESAQVADGDGAVAAYRQALLEGRPFDAVILDLTVPGGAGGRQTLARLREIDPTVRAIACSGYSNDPALEEPEAHGFAAQLTKPFDGDALGIALDTVLSRHA